MWLKAFEPVEKPFRKNIFSFFVLTLLLTLFAACSDGEKDSKSKSEKVEETEERISKIEIIEFGRMTTLKMKYSKNAVNIEYEPYEGNVEARIEMNKDKQIREILSGRQRIQYIYDDNGKQIGILSGSGIQQIMFDYEGDNIVAQHTIQGNDTIVSFLYAYANGLPTEVEIKGMMAYHRKYKLEYSDIKNQLSGFNEMILPVEISSLLGIPAIYGKNYLQKATRIDAGAATNEPLKENYTPKFEVVEFAITKSGKQEALKLVSDGTRQWSARIHW